MPNPNTIPWTHYQDIQIPDVSIRDRFRSFCLQGDFTSALQLLTTNEAQLHGKAYIADTINIICNGVLELESRFNNGVLIYLSTLVNQWQVLIDNMRKRGNWTANDEYKKNNFVVYQDEVYMALQDVPVSTLPTNATYWLKITIRGDDGANGLNVVMKYAWDEYLTYNVNDLVTYENNIYVCVKSNKSVKPNSDSTSWIPFIHVEVGKINVGINPPNTDVVGTIWFHTESEIGSDPVVGQYKRLRQDEPNGEKYWDEMYPETFFTLIKNNEYVRKSRIVDNVIITPSDWVGSIWTYKNSNIVNDSIVHILPDMISTSPSYKFYNGLTIEVTVGQFVLKTEKKVDQNIPIRIIIN